MKQFHHDVIPLKKLLLDFNSFLNGIQYDDTKLGKSPAKIFLFSSFYSFDYLVEFLRWVSFVDGWISTKLFDRSLYCPMLAMLYLKLTRWNMLKTDDVIKICYYWLNTLQTPNFHVIDRHFCEPLILSAQPYVHLLAFNYFSFLY